jgi:hypothetical protein
MAGGAGQNSGQVGVKTSNVTDDATAILNDVPDSAARIAKLQANLMVANIGLNAASTIHRATLDIINAQIDYLIAQDEADIKELKAIFAMIQVLMETMSDLNEGDQTAFEATLERLNEFLRVSLPSLHKPMFGDRA